MLVRFGLAIATFTSTLKQIRTDLKAAEAHRAELISRMPLRVVGDGKVES
jgi:hypothetical protein